ncbi:PIG-L family deacetylase [Actinoplanes sp. NBRC 103695]|uniref:PIG-L deacetylase family protein n=1 Tax=Actinoplanes sp. NBRC 103695 TaxID=3032202 RepID=UPI0024A1F11F|nr:PIG-L family deacetylase [Actinoplanes sp. NBRC 103695]GLY93198.1 PIG-L family deacetylase [Actinoplanes sp. NBRC 103695]
MPINWDPTGRNVYWFEPHQDDGCLFMAQAAAHHVLAERTVHVVLMSNGSTSNVLGELNGATSDSTWWGGFHDPAREGYSSLSKAEFGLARTREWRASWHQLGVPDARLHYGMDLASSADLPDGISTSYASSVMSFWMNRDLDAGLDHPGMYTMWWNDPHSDHAACGQALRALRLADPHFADGRWLTKPENASQAGATAYAVPANLAGEVKLMQKRSAWAYGAWAPANGAFAIGMHSVALPYFDDPVRGDPNYIVRNV